MLDTLIEPIALPDAAAYNATLVQRADETGATARFGVRLDAGAPSFAPGQYLTLGLDTGQRILQRPYSTASPATGNDTLEFYIRLVPVPRFTSLLWRIPVGHRLRVTGPKGKFTLEPDDERVHLMVSTGTGIAPFVSMLRTLRAEGRPRRAVVVHGVSHSDELGYRALLERWQAEDDRLLRYVPTVSRPDGPRTAGWTGRTGRAESILADVCAELHLAPHDTVAYLCGNPGMIANAAAVLASRGFPRESVKYEHYWPAGRDGSPGEAPA